MRDDAITNAIQKTEGKSFSSTHANMVVGIDTNTVAVAFNETQFNQNQIIVLDQRDAKNLFALLLQAGKAQGWLV